MALSGSWTHYWNVESETETVEVLVTYPVDLPESHPNYEQRGTSVSESVPLSTEHSQSYDDVYVRIQGCTVHNIDDGLDLEGNRELSIVYKVFNSESDKFVSGSEILRESVVKSWDFETETNPFSSAYTHLKTLNGFENLIDV